MAKTIDPALAARLREESERTREVAYPPGVWPARPNRSKVYHGSLMDSGQAQPGDDYLTEFPYLPLLARSELRGLAFLGPGWQPRSAWGQPVPVRRATVTCNMTVWV